MRGIFLLVALANGYGFLAHRIASIVIWELLGGEVQEKVGSIVGSKDAFIKLAWWPDRIKRKPNWKWTKKLHYLNTDDDPPNYCKVSFSLGRNLLGAAFNYTENFFETKSRDDLAFMVHFLMDLHQPMHLSSKFRGGNDYKVEYEGAVVSMHLLWDSVMLKRMLKTKGESAVVAEIKKYSELEHRGSKRTDGGARSICDWAIQVNAINCKIIFNKESKMEEHENALLMIMGIGAKRVADLIIGAL